MIEPKAGEAGLWQRLTDLERSPVYRLYRSVKIKLLIETLKDRDSGVRENAVKALVTIKMPAVAGLVKALKNKNRYVRYEAADALGKIAWRNPGNGEMGKAVPGLTEALKDGDGEVGHHAAAALGMTGNASAIPALIEALKDPKTCVRQAAALSLSMIAEKNPGNGEIVKAVPVLLEALKECRIPDYAAAMLGHFVNMNPGKEETVNVVPVLLEMMKDPNKLVRGDAAEALGMSGDISAVPALIEALKDEKENVRKEAARALGTIAVKNPGNEEILKAVPALAETLKDKDGPVRHTDLAFRYRTDASAVMALVQAIGNIAEKNPGKEEMVNAVPALIETLKDPKGDVQGKATEVLGNIIKRSPVEQLDRIQARIIEAVENSDRSAPRYRQMKYAAAKMIGAIYTRRNQLLSVEVNIDPNMVLKLPKPPPRSGGMYRAFAMVN